MSVQVESQSLLSRVKSRLYVRARRPVAHLLEGQYASMHRGRSLDFDDLRDYQPGDEVGDIDWRASARHSAIMVRRYGAERRHRLLFAVAGGRNLGAVSAAGERKADLAVEAVGILGWLALQHGDEVGALVVDARRNERFPFRVGEGELERLLGRIHRDSGSDTADSDLLALLRQVRDRERQRSLLVVVADEVVMSSELEELIATLSYQHELLWVELADAHPMGLENSRRQGSFDVAGFWALPRVLQGDAELAEAVVRASDQRNERLLQLLRRAGASYTRIDRRDEVAPKLLEMLKTRQYDRH